MYSGATTLFRWSLRMDGKSFWPHAARAAFTLMMLFGLGVAYSNSIAVTQVGLSFFQTMYFLNVLVITVSGISYFSTAVTEEKDAGTMALLQMAGMTPLTITLGKSTSRFVSSLMLLVAQIPFSLLAVTLGGILWQQVIAAWLGLAAWMFVVCNVALLCSARCTTSGRAAAASGVLAVFYFLLPELLPATVAAFPVTSRPLWLVSVADRIPEILLLISPLQQLDRILFDWPNTSLLSAQFCLSVLIGGLCFAISTWRLNAWTTHQGDDDPNSSFGPWRLSPGRAWKMAMAWREFHFFAGGIRFSLAKFFGGGVVLASFLWLQAQDATGFRFRLDASLSELVMLLFGIELTLELLLYSAGVLSAEVRQQTHTSLAMAPLGPTHVLLQKMLGCALSTIPALIWMAVILLLSDGGAAFITEPEVVLAWMIMLVFSCHLAALLSLYSRWAALPLTALISFVAFFVIIVPVLMIPATVDAIVLTHNFTPGRYLSWSVTGFSTWLFLILPMQLLIRKRWVRLTIG